MTTRKVKIAPTSLIVLAYARKLYQSPVEREYLSRIDFDEVKEIVGKLDKVYPHGEQLIILRKQFVRYTIAEEIARHTPLQVIILGAGMDALALHLVTTYPSSISRIIEVDNGYLMEKKELYAELIPGEKKLHLVRCDITQTDELMQQLAKEGYDPGEPAIIVFEGVIHYITNAAFLTVMEQFKTPDKRNLVILDYALPDEEVPEHALLPHRQMIQILESYVQRKLNINSSQQILDLVNILDGQVHQVHSLQEIGQKVNGKNETFHQRGEGVLEMLSFYL